MFRQNSPLINELGSSEPAASPSFYMVKALKFVVRTMFRGFTIVVSCFLCIVILVCCIVPMVIADWFDKIQEWADNGKA